MTVELNYDPHIRDMTIGQLENLHCEDCGELNMDFDGCPIHMQDNEAVCLDCCGHEH